MSQLLMLRPALPAIAPEPAFTISTAGASAAGRLAEVLASAFPEERWDAARVRRDLLDAADVEQTYVLEADGSLVATASARRVPGRFPGAGYLHWVAVTSGTQGRGFGSAVTRSVIGHFAGEPVYLETDDERIPAIAAYLGLGFTPVYPDETHRERWSAIFVALRQGGRRHREVRA